MKTPQDTQPSEKGELNHDKDRTYIRVLLSTVELSLHPLSSHEVESVRKEKERLTAASAALFLSYSHSQPLLDDWKVIPFPTAPCGD